MLPPIERRRHVMLPLTLLLMGLCMMLLVSIWTAKQMNSSLLGELEQSQAEMQISVENSESCGRDLDWKTEDVDDKLREIKQLNEKTNKIIEEHLRIKLNLEANNKLLLQLLMQEKNEKQKIIDKYSSLENKLYEIKNENVAEPLHDETEYVPEEKETGEEARQKEDEVITKIKEEGKEDIDRKNIVNGFEIDNNTIEQPMMEENEKEREEIFEYNSGIVDQTETYYSLSYDYYKELGRF
eukprot:GFUD01032526.1.p1 GENE.GFUD01032526.1~~GFUD01032526.1.p1  ORF type:complete len:240 (-),score=79.04 GFUD01032526.1:202-921(-)